MPKSKKRKSNRIVLTTQKNSTTQTTIAPRNPYSDHPLMKKGGVHKKSKSAERSQTRRETKQLARDWSSSLFNIFIC